ncbi:hypothetical protein DENSPDRAFT_834285, partial [Dentipellis sp. KUC8613]
MRNTLAGLQSQNAVGEVLTELRLLLAYTGVVYNSKAGINRLPSEILYKVFSICANLENPFPPSVNRAGYPTKDLLVVTQVCRHWRDVALAYHNLWARISVPPCPQWTAELLLRARTAPLAIHEPELSPSSVRSGYPSMQLLAILSRYHGQIAELGLQSLPKGNVEQLVSALQRPFPRLASVTIRGQYIREASPPWTDILNDLGQNAPALRNLTTYSLVAAPWSSCESLRGLTSVAVKLPRLDRLVNDDGDAFDHAYATPTQLLTMLREMPLLESLELHYCTSLIPAPTEDCVLRVPNLKFLHMRGRAYPLSSLLRHLILSPAAQVLLTVDVPEKAQDVFSQLTYHADGSLPLTLPSVEGPGRVPLTWQSLEVITDTSEFLECAAWHAPNTRSRPSLIVRFVFSVFTSFRSSCRAVQRLLPAAELRAFSVAFDSLFPSWWTDYAQGMMHLRTIEFLNGNAASAFMRWMSMTPQYLPELREMWFTNVDFRIEDLAEVCLIALQSRARHGSQLEVVLQDCCVSDAWLDIVAEMEYVEVV